MRPGTSNDRAWMAAGALLGMGMGGFFDGIVFHQILQLHNMLSNWIPKDTIANVEINMVWDGLFHASCWLMVVLALTLSWRAIRRRGSLPPGRSYVGAAGMGWGIFNLVEGIVDHQILQVHHVHQYGDHLLWDLVFLASGVLLVVVGLTLARRPAAGESRPATPRASS